MRRLGVEGIEGEVLWAGTDSRGKEVRPGVYFARLLVGGHEFGRARKLVLLR